ncbi:hypothetical protein BDV93DRAFT_509793 [Ceratobasidium sp. AG-I]|nr:hypothetical protein BDV93DRAFT_509793 [Ceratobasidium sp. AG-I]
MLHILPPEVIELILEQCRYIEILRASETCKKLFDVVSNSAKIQLHIELESSGFQLCKSALRSEQGPAELLEKLRSVRDKWLYLGISDPNRLEFPQPLESMIEYIPRLGYISASLGLGASPSAIFRAFDLATHQARTIEPGVEFFKSSVDVSQNLLVLISSAPDTSTYHLTVHLRMYTDGTSHPSALLSSWAVQLPFTSYNEYALQIEFLDNLLAISFLDYDDQNEILVWDWKSGAFLNRISIEGSCSFGFLTSNCLSVFNCTYQLETDHSIGLFVYGNIQGRLSSTSASPTDVYVVADYTPLLPDVEFCFPSRVAPLSAIVQHSTRSQRDPSTSDSMDFRTNQDSPILHLTLSFYRDNEIDDTSPQDTYDIFASKPKLLEYIADSAPSTGNWTRIDWIEWVGDCTRWFRSESALELESSRWVMEGVRAIGTSYLKQENDGRHVFDYITLLDFHSPTVQRFSNSCNKHRSMSPWKGVGVRHVDLDNTQTDLASLFEILEDREHGYDVFVDIIDEHTPAFTQGFEGGTIVSRLPYRIVTRRMPRDRWSRWTIDQNRIVEVPPQSPSSQPADGQEQKYTGWATVPRGLAITTLFIIIRSVYRTIELTDGW